MFSHRIKNLVNEELKQYFRPEFLNRLDEIIVFRQLTKTEVKQIADIMLREVFSRAEEKGIKIEPMVFVGITVAFVVFELILKVI